MQLPSKGGWMENSSKSSLSYEEVVTHEASRSAAHLAHGLIPAEAVQAPGPGAPVVDAEAAVQAVVADAHRVAGAHEVELPGHGGVPARVA